MVTNSCCFCHGGRKLSLRYGEEKRTDIEITIRDYDTVRITTAGDRVWVRVHGRRMAREKRGRFIVSQSWQWYTSSFVRASSAAGLPGLSNERSFTANMARCCGIRNDLCGHRTYLNLSKAT